MKSILILGSSGMLGKQLSKYLKKFFKVSHNGLTRRKLDLTKKKYLKKILNKDLDLIINCAAETDIDRCEKNKVNCDIINFQISKNIFEIAREHSYKFKYIFISTDQFYNNKKNSLEKDKLSMLNEYSKSKRKAEKIVLANNGIILRTNFFGKTISNKSFSDWVYKKFRSEKKFYLFNDIYFSPVRIDTLSRAIKKIILNPVKRSAIYNIGSTNGLSKKDFAIFFAKKCGIYNKNYEISTSKKILNTNRSKYMIMNSSKFKKEFKFNFKSLKKEIIDEIKNYKN